MLLSNPPSSLREIQKWFGNVITTPLNEDNTSKQTTFLYCADQYVTPNQSLMPQERIQIYNQQYWWRLFSAMQRTFPATLRLFGYGDFNHLLVTPYLTQFPSRNWSINKIGEEMLTWMQKFYKEDDKGLVFQTMKLDFAFHRPVTCKHYKPISPDDDLTQKIKLQPHVTLLKFDGPFYEFREALLKESVEHWLENDFPPIPKDKTHYYLIYRSTKLFILSEKISKEEYKLLSHFKKGATLEEACSFLEGTEEGLNIQKWFQTWTERELLWLRKS